MYRRRPRSAYLRRKKILLRSRQVFHAKCFQKIRDTNAIQILVHQKNLDPLDLAVESLSWKREFFNVIKLKIIRCLPPNCAEYLLPETDFPKGTTLEMEFQSLSDFIGMQFDVSVQIRQDFIKQLYFFLEKQIVFHDNYQKSEVLQIVRNYLKLVKIINPYHLEISKFPFNQLFKSLVNIMCNELETMNSSLMVPMGDWIRNTCVDEDSMMSIFQSMTEIKCLEYVLYVARCTRFDFWGLWIGEGFMSENFNPVATNFGFYRRYSLARVLLKFGFQYSQTKDVYEDRCQQLAFLSYHDMPIISFEDIDVLIEKRGERMQLILDIFMTFLNSERNEDYSDALFTLIYISRSLPSPYVTSTELFWKLKDVLKSTFHKRLIEICKKYSSEEIYDDDYREYKPRKLLHLCRCAIRKLLTRNLKFPEGMNDLKIPFALKDYLLLEC